jgi:hypothetical protein
MLRLTANTDPTRIAKIVTNNIVKRKFPIETSLSYDKLRKMIFKSSFLIPAEIVQPLRGGLANR